MQVEQKDREIEKSEQIEVEESDAYSLFVYAVRSQITKDYYLRRLRIFLNHISLRWNRIVESKEACYRSSWI
jgi:hypothetical protein